MRTTLSKITENQTPFPEINYFRLPIVTISYRTTPKLHLGMVRKTDLKTLSFIKD